jgi:hypothetical protein
MAEAQLNFDENALDTATSLYDLYSRFYEGMRIANLVDAPDYVTNPPTTNEGEIDTAAIMQGLAEYSTILMKNSAYMMANAIISTIGDGGGSGGSVGAGYLSRNGDSMAGQLGALYGFQTGYNNQLIFDVSINADEKKTAHVYGQLIVDDNLSVSGQLNMSDNGIYFSKHQMIYYADDKLHVNSENMLFTGDIEVVGSLSIGDIVINENGLFSGEQEFYHSGNSNNKDTDWNMRNAHVYGDLVVDGSQEFNGFLSALQGFELGADGKKLFYSFEDEETGFASLRLATDLALLTGYGIKFNDNYIVRVRGGADNIVSFSAPGMVMNLGDSDGETPTSGIALQTGIYNYNSDYCMVSQYGDGNFKNSLSAGCANSGPTVIQTYYRATDDCGVVFARKIRLGGSAGPSLYTDSTQSVMGITIPYTHIINDSANQTDHLPISLSYQETNSLFKDQSKIWSASLHINTDAEFFTFKKPIEGKSFSIISELYKTRLIENTLFFDDGKFLEGVTDGIRHTGNAYFANNLSSMEFASGFAGYGWAINESELYGGIAATFDELTIRKKMRVYELEVQRQSVTNGSLWVSDACSGDIVEEIA